MDLGFLVLCHDNNKGGLRNTLGSIRNHAWNRSTMACVGMEATNEDLASLGSCCPVARAGNTITSLVNLGMKSMETEWVFILFSGSRIPVYLERKLAMFVESDKDVLFPVVDRKWDFVSGSFNGVLISRRFFAEVGDFPDGNMQKQGVNDFELAKMWWALGALECGVQFKAIVGMRII